MWTPLETWTPIVNNIFDSLLSNGLFTLKGNIFREYLSLQLTVCFIVHDQYRALLTIRSIQSFFFVIKPDVFYYFQWSQHACCSKWRGLSRWKAINLVCLEEATHSPAADCQLISSPTWPLTNLIPHWPASPRPDTDSRLSQGLWYGRLAGHGEQFGE